MNKVIVIKGEPACGDLISYNGLLNYLQKYFNKIFFYIPSKSNLMRYEKRQQLLNEFGKELYKNHNKVEIINDYNNLKSKYPDLYMLDGCCRQNVQNWYKLNNDKFINKNNPIYNVINIDENDKINNTIECENNSDFFYIPLGLKKEIKLDYFIYERNNIEEDKIFNKFKKDKYIIICEYDKFLINKKYIKNKDLPIINVHFLIDNPLYLLKLIENAEEIHLIENSISLTIYHMQYSKILKSFKVFYHKYARQREYFKDKTVEKMVLTPKLENWEIINEK